ncbi:putative cell division control protein Cdc6 [Talaromyces proteolyticus]|uniref:Cell division control protein n=1 Tax=Talaromyces proteolyticus TaxID=1131652 RepID=A0AAD4KW36_9EURO|nr:putative cell division control protein Cdc6 [Talaromyces proteolyticus]KAH8698287.1 putative cell division control protein Cdc6 [Talaromyces proteolyticus]
MAATVLGKRSRAAIDLEEPLPLRSGSKRRARPPRIHEEEQSPNLSTASPRSKAVDCSGPFSENDANVKKLTIGNSRSKRNVRNDNTLSPSKIDSHFKASKPVNNENVKPTEFKTPQSKRFRDALANSPPVTPKHRVQVGGKSLTPRTPRNAGAPATNITVYTPARQMFARSANPGRLIGRERERAEMTSFIEGGMESRKGGCMYISGPPGTGKSAMLDEVCRDLNVHSVVKSTHVNCVSMRTARDIYGKLIETLCDDSEVFSMSEAEKLKSMFIPAKKSTNLYLVTLDEIDHLLTADPEILYSLFEWSLNSKSHLLLIGIANALDLTDRFLPRLKSNNMKPILLPFLPYSAAQIADVINARLRSLLPTREDIPSGFVPFVQPAAVQLCAKKVASQTGDLRKAFDLVKRAIDVIEQETQTKLEKENTNDVTKSPSKPALTENVNLSSPPRTPNDKVRTLVDTYTALTAPRASIAHVARITAAVFSQGTTQRLQGLNLQQKAALCALVALDRKRRSGKMCVTPSKSKTAAPTVRELFDSYCSLCRLDNVLHPLTATEFKDVIGSLETLGLVGEFQGRGRGGTIASGSGIMRTPSKSGSSASTPFRGTDEKGLACFVMEKEIVDQIAGPGEGILKAMLAGDCL